MNFLSPLIFMLLLTTSAMAAHPEDRYPVCENGLWGYIDHTGAVKIAPQYHSAGSFCDGLAPVRSGGYYGYIDADGKTVIEPQYDFAGPFFSGKALVYRGSKPYLIDTKGKTLFEHSYTDIFGVDKENDRYHVRTVSGKYGVTDVSGKLLEDTVIVERWEAYRLERTRDHRYYPEETPALPGELTLREKYSDGKTVFSYYNDQQELVHEYSIDWSDNDKNIDYKNEDALSVSDEGTELYEWFETPQAENRTDSCIVLTLTQTLIKGNNGRTKRTNSLTIKNVTQDSLPVPVQDNMLRAFMQARDQNGEWRDIEEITPSGCGNSYYSILMAPQKEWVFIVNNYSGSFPTELRMRMMLRGGEKPIELFSNAVQGSVNPGQFWNTCRIIN